MENQISETWCIRNRFYDLYELVHSELFASLKHLDVFDNSLYHKVKAWDVEQIFLIGHEAKTHLLFLLR